MDRALSQDERLETAAETALQMRGLSTLLDVCAEGFLNEPRPSVLADLRAVAQAMGDGRFDAFEASDELTQRYYDRVLVASSPLFVPLQESCVRRSAMQGDTRCYASSGSAYAGHVERCYQAAGFDVGLLKGFDLALRSLRPDSLAAELAFVAFLLRQAGEHPAQLAAQFCTEHLCRWVGIAQECLMETDDDLYARLGAFSAEAVEAAVALLPVSNH